MALKGLAKVLSSTDGLRLRTDSRLVEEGDVFVAVKGTALDGHDFIDQAISNGARYIVCQGRAGIAQPNRDARVPSRHFSRLGSPEVITVEDSAAAAGLLAQAAFAQPASRLVNLAVTGTNGKTTVAFLVRAGFQAAGEKCGLMGTVVYDSGGESCEANLTTPDCLTIAAQQSRMVNAGAKYMIMEASSHALEQNRLAGIDFAAAAFTNLTGDHLDYHRTKENYLDAKAKLFERLGSKATAVLNKQSPEAQTIAERTSAKILWFAIDESADITARAESMDIAGTSFVIDYAGQREKVQTPLLGRHNVANHLAAAGLCIAAGLKLEPVAAGLSALSIIPGRLERINRVPSRRFSRLGSHPDGDFAVLVDYAHTDDALLNVLSTLRPLCENRLIVVFGCGGDRDRTKRPRMARAAERFADMIIVTSDNPRTEDPDDIIAEIITGFEKRAAPAVTIEPDRRIAIETAIASAKPGDIVLIAGKGHETYQIVGAEKLPFSDKDVALKFLMEQG